METLKTILKKKKKKILRLFPHLFCHFPLPHGTPLEVYLGKTSFYSFIN